MPNSLLRIIKNASGGLLLFLPVLSAFAQNNIRNPIGATNFTQIIDAITNFAVLIIIPISVLVILYAGALFMFSGGDVEKVKKAKHALLWALVGIAIVLTGKGFIYIIQDVLNMGRQGPGF